LYFPRFAKNPLFLNKNTGGKKPEILIQFFIFSETFFLKCTCTRTHANINLFLRETRNVENRKPNYFCLLWRWIILFLFYIYRQQMRFVFCFCKKESNLCWWFYVHYFLVFSAYFCFLKYNFLRYFWIKF
jgi:hypothetical protein